MENSERLDRLTMLVFKQKNLKKIREATNNLFDIFHDVLEKDFEYGAYFSTKDIHNRLEQVDKKYWREIRNLYLYEEYYGYNDGNFSDDEMNSPAKLMMDMLAVLSKCKDGVFQKVDQKHKELQAMEAKVDEMRDKTTDLYQQLLDEKKQNADRKMEFAKLNVQVSLLEDLLEEKKEKITELMKDRNVQLCEKEKEKLLEGANKKIDELEEEIANLKLSKQRYTRRMSTVDDQNKLLKMKQELLGHGDSEDGETGSEEVQQLKREIYIKDKDIAHLEEQFYQEQKIVLGILGGIKTDLNILSETFYDSEEAVRDPDFVKLTKTLDKLYAGACEGRLAMIKMMLPPHYTYFDKEFKVKKLRRLSKAASLPKMIPTYPESKSPLPVIGAALGQIGSTNGTMPSTPEETPNRKLESVCENPVIVDPRTGKLNSFGYLQHFPHMAQTFILDHWKKFKEYDDDHSLTLDLKEVSKVLQSLGCKFTPDQIEEAIEEVDLDHSHTVDFYEYLLVVDKVIKKSGKSKLFKTGLNKQNEVVSSACVVQ